MSSLTKSIVYQACPSLAAMKSAIIALIPSSLATLGSSGRERALRRAEAIWRDDTLDQTVTVYRKAENGIVILLRV